MLTQHTWRAEENVSNTELRALDSHIKLGGLWLFGAYIEVLKNPSGKDAYSISNTVAIERGGTGEAA